MLEPHQEINRGLSVDDTISGAWIQAGTAVVICLFTAATGWLFYQINKLHDRISNLKDFNAELMRDHEGENRKFREDMISRLSRIEGRANGRP